MTCGLSQIKPLALKWFFLMSAGVAVYAEFSHVLMKQLGLNAQQIGASNSFGAFQILTVVLLYVGDRYRARYLIVWMVTILMCLNCLLPVLPLAVSLPSCFSDTGKQSSINATEGAVKQEVPWNSRLYLLLLMTRSTYSVLGSVGFSMGSLATFTYLGEQRGEYGTYYMWTHVGMSAIIGTTAVLAWAIRTKICGVEGYGYFIGFLFAAGVYLLQMLSLPFFEYTYDVGVKVNWTEIRNTVLNFHYIYMFVLTFHVGASIAFQTSWEFWYLDGIGASPLVMGAAALIRRPMIACFVFASGPLIRRIGDLQTVCVAFALFAVAFLVLSFSRIYWYVLIVDTLQGAAYGMARTAFMMHYSKLGSQGSRGFILGMEGVFFGLGEQCGVASLGLLFHALGTQTSLLIFSGISALMLTTLLLYLKFSKHVDKYKRIPNDDINDDVDGTE